MGDIIDIVLVAMGYLAVIIVGSIIGIYLGGLACRGIEYVGVEKVRMCVQFFGVFVLGLLVGRLIRGKE